MRPWLGKRNANMACPSLEIILHPFYSVFASSEKAKSWAEQDPESMFERTGRVPRWTSVCELHEPSEIYGHVSLPDILESAMILSTS